MVHKKIYIYMHASAHYIQSQEDSSFLIDVFKCNCKHRVFLFGCTPPWGRFLSALRPRFPCRMTHQLGSLRRVLSSFWSLWKQGISDGTVFFGQLQLQAATSPSAETAQRFRLLGLLIYGREKGKLFLLARRRKLYHLWTGFLIPHMGPYLELRWANELKMRRVWSTALAKVLWLNGLQSAVAVTKHVFCALLHPCCSLSIIKRKYIRTL